LSVSVRRLRVASYGVLRRDGALLLVRASGASGAPGTWWLPGGGVEFGEAPADALVREFAEETGLVVAVGGRPFVVSDVIVRGSGESVHSVRLCYAVELKGGSLKDEVAGTTDRACWVTEADVDALPLQPFVREALASV
jgi:8-oxo-dGTP diphosphatase